MRKLLNCILYLIFLMPLFTNAQEWISSTKIYDATVTCTANNGTLVPLLLSDNAIALGGGGYAHFDPKNGASIMISPTYLQKLPRAGAFFLFYHECAHVALPLGIGLGNFEQESNADCYAVSEMRKAGLIKSWSDFVEALTLIKDMPASTNLHLPGPERVLAAAQCVDIPLEIQKHPFCRTVEMIFSVGIDFLKRTSFDPKKIVDGYRCEITNKKLYCSRQFKNDETADAYRVKLIKELNSCLLPDFKYHNVHVFDGWENSTTRKTINMTTQNDQISFIFRFDSP
ncbi:MAG: hypothetical protein DID89_2727546961 [Candidatus Nitrotoga sp. CP45]|nr:MAG: hypothetical protein DID89_2727546961 [Candidatus Nitrotoga sp. CP45]